ncbi:MAG: hypothetical protein HQM09_22505 [Candidatus Riflebacteria bacterium]|nr:hypothetical protein [Candidatus Riflebacteria bacterium]
MSCLSGVYQACRTSRRLCRNYLIACLMTIPGLFAFQTAAAMACDGLNAAPPNPALCAYFRIQESFQMLVSETASGTALSSAMEAMKSFAMFHGENDKGHKNASGPNFIGTALEFCRYRAFIPETLFIYLSPPDDYVIYVIGSVLPERWRDLFPPRSVVARSDGFAVTNPAPGSRNPPLLHFSPGSLLICPTNLEGTVLDTLREDHSALNEKWDTFKRMISRRPLFALETDLEDLFARLGPRWNCEEVLPAPFREISTMRWIVDASLFKLQFFLNRDESREQILQTTRELIDNLKNSLPAASDEFQGHLRPILENMRTNVQGKSVFLEGPGLGKATTDAGNRLFGIITRLAAGTIPASH